MMCLNELEKEIFLPIPPPPPSPSILLTGVIVLFNGLSSALGASLFPLRAETDSPIL